MDAITYPNSGSPRNTPADVLTAHLTGDNMCRMGGIYPRQGSAPVLALCRELIAAGYDPSAQLQVYRGSTLCLLVRSVGEA
ncbi:MAG TPA: hypothetical protein VIR04_08950, partial [Paralcaligenes sp.]